MREHGRDATAALHGRGLSAPDLAADKRAGTKKHAKARCSYGRRMAVTVSQMFIPVHDPDLASALPRRVGLEVRNDSLRRFRWVTAALRAGHRHRLFQPHGVVRGRGRRPPVAHDAGSAGCDLPPAPSTPRSRMPGSAQVPDPASQPGAARLRVPRPSGHLVRSRRLTSSARSADLPPISVIGSCSRGRAEEASARSPRTTRSPPRGRRMPTRETGRFA